MHNTPHTARPRVPIGLILGLLVLALVPIIGAGAWLWLQWAELAARYPFIADTLRIAVFLLPLVLGAYAVLTGLTIAWRRWGWRESVYADKQAAMVRAQVQVAPLASSFHYELNSDSTATEAPALPAPMEITKSQAEWLAWVDDTPHVMLAGRTKAGKTHTATALLARRVERGADIFIIDPHSSDWLGLPTANGRGALKAVLSEYLRRLEVRERHKKETGRELPHDYFDPLTVIVDEANSLLEEFPAEWKVIIKQLASGARKVGIGLIMLCQSPLVEDLGISGSMRENFARLALDDKTVQQLVDSERDKARKEAMRAALVGNERPAAAQIGAQVWLLDRQGLAAGQPSDKVRMWRGWDYASGRAVSSVSRSTNDTSTTEGAGESRLIADPDTSGILDMDAVSIDTDAQIKQLVEWGYSANKIYSLVGGNRNDVLEKIRTLKGGA